MSLAPRSPHGLDVEDEPFRRFFEDLSESAYVVDQQTGLLLAVNEAAARMYGYTVEELVGQPAKMISTEPEKTHAAVTSGDVTERFRLHKRKDGSVFPIESQSSVSEWGGRAVRIGIIRDVSETRRIEQELHEKRRMLKNAFDDSPLSMTLSELETGRYLDVNDAFCRTTGFSREEAIGRLSTELGIIRADERANLASAVRRDHLVHALELRLHRKDGTPFSARLWGEVIETTAGPHLFTACEDMTEWKAADDARSEASARLQKLASRIPGVVYQFRMHPDGRVTVPYCSPGMRDLFQVDLDELRIDARPVFTRVHPDDIVAVQASIAASAHDLSPWQPEFRVLLEDGEHWLQGNALPEREADGSTLWHGFITDSSERKRLQAGLAQSDRLASMGMLAAGVAHEINNPLAYVISNLDGLDRELPKLVGFTERCVALVRDELGEARLAALINDAADVLAPGELEQLGVSARAALEGTHRIRKISRGLGTFARVEHAEMESVDLNQALETAAAMAQNEVKFRATLLKQLAPLPPVWASDGKLAQVFLNLIINAAHAIPEGHVDRHRITLRTWAVGGQVFAEVSDTGHGIPPALLERIFEPFFTTKQAGHGSGLGLAITRNLVTELGGRISVQSEVGHGTRFCISFPELREPVRASAPARPEVVKPLSTRVLVVDDEAPIRRTLSRVLSKDHDVVAVGSGREARDLLERDRAFDVILCDLMMPDMTGMELHAWLNEVDPVLAQRVVFCSGGAFTPNAAEYLARVGNPRLEKPFDNDQLRALVSARVASAGVRGEAR